LYSKQLQAELFFLFLILKRFGPHLGLESVQGRSLPLHTIQNPFGTDETESPALRDPLRVLGILIARDAAMD
jgi:hypothetical protein